MHNLCTKLFLAVYKIEVSFPRGNIGDNDCTEGSVTVVSDVLGSSLQLVEMCSSEGVWSPVCDNNWTLQDATVVCRELVQGSGTIKIHFCTCMISCTV